MVVIVAKFSVTRLIRRSAGSDEERIGERIFDNLIARVSVCWIVVDLEATERACLAGYWLQSRVYRHC